GCLEHIEKWTQDQALILLVIVLVIMFVEVTTLFSILLACSRKNRRSKSQTSTFTSTQTLSPFTENDHDFKGSEERRAVDVKDMNKRETCDDTKYNGLAMSGKSIIEEWRNPPKYSADLLRSDQVYEERAIDVVIDNHPQSNLPKRHLQYASLSKIADNNTNKNNDDDKLVKIKRVQCGSTVRSIPIKDYQASIAHNIGTLKRSVAPQSQFESLVSEPEKSVYLPLKKRIPLTSSLHHRSASQTTCIAAQTLKADNIRKKFCCFCDGQHDLRDFYCANADSSKHVEDIRYFNKTEDRRSSQDGSDIDEYFHRSSHGRFSNDYQISRNMRESSGNTGTITTETRTKNEKAKAQEEVETLQLAEGHVGKKISVYEQNARRSLRSVSSRYRSPFEIKGYCTIGVPLVGMHNACGLPVVASWHDHELLDTLRITHKLAKTAGHIYKSPRTNPNMRHRTQSRRKVLQPDRGMIHPSDIDCGVKRSTIKSVGYLDVINSSGRSRRKHRHSSFTVTKMGSLSSKNSSKRMPKRYGIKASSLMNTFGRKSIKSGNTKRTTLYAKDDGEESIQVLKSLCLNPLARANPETDMMW
ncbi:hypothetical protein ALC62_05173, partial [Cyphomyrmex costatus]